MLQYQNNNTHIMLHFLILLLSYIHMQMELDNINNKHLVNNLMMLNNTLDNHHNNLYNLNMKDKLNLNYDVMDLGKVLNHLDIVFLCPIHK